MPVFDPDSAGLLHAIAGTLTDLLRLESDLPTAHVAANDGSDAVYIAAVPNLFSRIGLRRDRDLPESVAVGLAVRASNMRARSVAHA